jgi:hypothetical protein
MNGTRSFSRVSIRKAAGRGAAGGVFDAGGVRVPDRSDGYYWKFEGGNGEHGPFETLVHALDDAERGAGVDRIGKPDAFLDNIGYEAAFPRWPGDEAA